MRLEDNAIADASDDRARRRGAKAVGGIDAVGLELLHLLGIGEA